MGIKGFNQNNPKFRNLFTRALGGDSTGLDAAGPDPIPLQGAGITATGGTKEPGVNVNGTTYTYHYFTSSPLSFDVTHVHPDGPGEVEFLIVAGGGAGGYSQNGVYWTHVINVLRCITKQNRCLIFLYIKRQMVK